MDDAFRGSNSLARSARYGLEMRVEDGTFECAVSAIHQLASAKAMRRDSIAACRYCVELCWDGVKCGILPASSRASKMPRAISATIPCPLGGCSQISSPWLSSFVPWPEEPSTKSP